MAILQVTWLDSCP